MPAQSQPPPPPEPTPPAPPLVATLLGAVMAALDSLHSSLIGSFSVPGESPAVLTSDYITMVSQLDSPAAGSRLFTQGLAAASGAGFDPLPSDLLSGVSPDAVSGGVQTHFLSLGFSPYPLNSGDVALAPSVTRLRLTAGDSAESVASSPNRTSPIRLRIPAPESTSAGSAGVCRFWDEGAGAFSGEGCATLPAVYPPGHGVAWASPQQILLAASPRPLAQNSTGAQCTATLDAEAVAFFNATGPAAAAKQLAVSWQLFGPAACGCTATVLDCARENAERASGAAATRRKVYLSPRDAILFPAVACKPSGGAAMLVFYGAPASSL